MVYQKIEKRAKEEVEEVNDMKCLMLGIEMPIGEVCPNPYNKDGFKCNKECSCADIPELINEKVKNWEKLKKGELGMKKGEFGMKKDGLELEKIGTKTPDGSYILEGNLAYIEQEEEGKVKVATISGINEVVPINGLQEFVDNRSMDDEIREELRDLISHIPKK